MKKSVFLILLCFGIHAQAPHRFGAIDGVSIPDEVLNTPREAAITSLLREPNKMPSETEIQNAQDKVSCRRLTSTITQAASARAKGELGVFVTNPEIEAFRKTVPPVTKENQALYRERLEALVAGLSAVYDQGKDPQQVYQQLVAPHVRQSDWAQELYLGRDKKHREILANDLAYATPEEAAKMVGNFDAKPGAEIKKLEATIDAQLSASDPKFKSYLDEWNAKVTHPTPYQTRIAISGAVTDYLAQKRSAWWKAETGKLNVTLSDQSLYTTCGLAAMGVTVPAH